MSKLAIIQSLCELLAQAAAIIRKQAELLAMHGISTEDGKLEGEWARLLADIEERGGIM